ncbi:MAG: hypothetical protein ACRDU4_00755, partial [Mycobacterium sp.]
ILGSRLTTTAAQGRSGSLQPDIWHHFVCVSTGTNTSSSALFYMDGHFMGCVLDEPQAFNHQTMDPPPSTVRNLTYLLLAGLPAFGGMLLDGSIAHVALYPTALTQPRILQHYLAGRNGFQGETLRERLVRILRYLGQGDLTASAALDTSQIPVAKQGTTAALSLIHELETTEQGLFYIDPAGIPTFRNRSRRYVSPVLTLSMLPGDGDIEPDGLQPVLDEQRVLNDVTTTTTGGYVSRATDPTSIAARGTYEDSGVQTVGVSPTNADETSRWIVANRSVPSLRVPTVTVKLLTRPALWNAVLSADLLDQITFSNPIAGYNLGNLAIEGIAGKFGLRDADVTFTVTPNLPSPTVYTVGVAGSDELDTSTARLGF